MKLPTIDASIEAIKAAPIHGNAYHDMPLFEAIDELCRDESVADVDKYAALDKQRDAMGLGMPDADADELAAYLEDEK